MEQKNDKNDKIENNKINEEVNKEKKENKGGKGINKPSPWIFLLGDNLQGFHLAFILMIIIPLSVFFIIRTILNKYNFTKIQQDVFGVIGVLVSVWTILVSLAIYYFKDDCYTVFCKRNKNVQKEKSE